MKIKEFVNKSNKNNLFYWNYFNHRRDNWIDLVDSNTYYKGYCNSNSFSVISSIFVNTWLYNDVFLFIQKKI